MGVTPQTCHKVIELTLKIVPKPVEGIIPQVKKFNLPGNKQDEYMNCILCKFMDLSPISPPEDYNHIMNIFQTTKRNILGYYKSERRIKPSSRTVQIQRKLEKAWNLVSTEKSEFSVIQAKYWEKLLYLCFTNDRDLRYKDWLNRLENLDYSKRTRLLFSELRSKNCVLETFNAIRNSKGSLSESHSECLSYWASYCEKLYCGHDLKPNRFLPVENKDLDYPTSFVEFKLAR